MKSLFKKLCWIGIGASLLLALIYSFKTQPITVDIATIDRGKLLVTLDDDGTTRVRERYTVSAPIRGRLLRTGLDPGDAVHKGETVVAEFAPLPPHLLDARSRQEAKARLRRAEAGVKEAAARLKQAEADLSYAQSELQRNQELVELNIGKQEALDRAQRDAQRAREGLNAATFAAEMARFGRDLAEASLLETEATLGDDKHQEPVVEPTPRSFKLHSPISGQVLRIYEESTRTLEMGTPILELGNAQTLEISADYLSQDAVKVKPGMRVRVLGWGGEKAPGTPEVLQGRVRLREPSGFTKISALGVEEQRVNIIVDPDSAKEQWAALGDGFRVELQIELWSSEDVLLVPTGALFRKDGSWAVFLVVDGFARLKKIRIGRRTGLQAQVLEGVMEGDAVILYPSELIEEGKPVTARPR